MEALIVWASLLVPSMAVGFIVSRFLKGNWGLLLSALIPWSGLLAALLYDVYGQPYQAKDASMWPIAQFFGGTAAALAGMFAYKLGLSFFGRSRK